MNRFDAIVIGDGVNGLLCASYLASAGRSVALVPRTEKNRASYAADWQDSGSQSFPTSSSRYFDFGSTASKDHHLTSFGMRSTKQGGGISFIEGCEPFIRDEQPAAMVARLSALTPNDAEAYMSYLACIERLGNQCNAAIKSGARNDVSVDAQTRTFFEASMRDVLERFFARQDLKDHLAQAACNVGLCEMGLGPFAPTTSFALLRDPVLRQNQGDLLRTASQGEITRKLSDYAVGKGVVIIADSLASKILVDRGKARGVKLASGLEVKATCVISDFDKQSTLRDLMPVQENATKIRKPNQNSRSRGSIAQINVTFDASPALHQKYAAMAKTGPLFFNGGLDNLEMSYDAWRNSDVPERPPFELVFFPPDETDSRDLTASIYISFVPSSLKVGVWDEARRFTLCTEITNEVNNWLPDFSNHLTHIKTVTPDMYQSHFGVSGGQLGGLEKTFDQWMRQDDEISHLLFCGPGASLFEIESGWTARKVSEELLGAEHFGGGA